MRRIVIAGNSAGAQLVSRLPLLPGPRAMLAARGIELDYVAAGPSTLVYLSGRRPVHKKDIELQLGRSLTARERAQIHQYRYEFVEGAPELPPALRGLRLKEARRNVIDAGVLYVVGELDDDVNTGLQQGIDALAQGATRLDRVVNYAYWHLPDIAKQEGLPYIPRVAIGKGSHSARSTFLDENVYPALLVPRHAFGELEGLAL